MAKITTGKVLKSKLKQAEKQIEAKGWVVLGVGPDPDERYWRVTWQEVEMEEAKVPPAMVAEGFERAIRIRRANLLRIREVFSVANRLEVGEHGMMALQTEALEAEEALDRLTREYANFKQLYEAKGEGDGR